MGIKVEESALAGAITSIPELLMQATQLKKQSDAQDQALAMKNMQMQQSALEMEEFKKTRGMDAAGYGNLEISEYFENLAYSPASINMVGGELSYSGEDAFPTIDEAMKVREEYVLDTWEGLLQ